MSVNRLAWFAASVHWAVKGALTSLIYLDSDAGVPAPLGRNDKLRDAYRRIVSEFFHYI